MNCTAVRIPRTSFSLSILVNVITICCRRYKQATSRPVKPGEWHSFVSRILPPQFTHSFNFPVQLSKSTADPIHIGEDGIITLFVNLCFELKFWVCFHSCNIYPLSNTLHLQQVLELVAQYMDFIHSSCY